MSPGGTYSGFDKYGGVTSWPTASADILHHSFSGLGNVAPNAPASAMAISADGKWAATVESGVIYVGRLQSGLQATGTGTALAASADTSAVAFLGRDNQLVSAADDTLALWNLTQTSRFSSATGISVPQSGTVGYPPSLLLSPNGQDLAVVDGFGGGSIYDTGPALRQATTFASNSVPLWRGNQLLLVRYDDAQSGIQITNNHRRIISQWNARESLNNAIAMRLFAGGLSWR
jgi:hypothetical protein